jgi:hypothetical protein
MRQPPIRHLRLTINAKLLSTNRQHRAPVTPDAAQDDTGHVSANGMASPGTEAAKPSRWNNRSFVYEYLARHL